MTSAAQFPAHVIGIRGCLRCQRVMLASRADDHVCWEGKEPPRRLRREIGERDGWTCQLCGLPVDRALPRSDPLGPSLDHRLPRSDGGNHAPENLQLAHAICNWMRNSRPLEQIDPAEHRALVTESLERRARRAEQAAEQREHARREGIRRRRRGQRARRRAQQREELAAAA